ncbi:MAG: RHS repeat-associated core domain-containing protein [Desulfobacterales bacterium]|nr:RHS repeat-associated core domain-containing protein [Desulfobacterales bacterium]
MPVTMTADSSVYYLTYDQVGSLRVVTDASGTVVKKTDYDSFGNIYSDSNSTFEVPFGFAGGLHDRDTGLVRFGYRDYDPDTGRWTAKDPIRFAGGDTDLYGYCLNDPINFIDPRGEMTLTELIVVVVIGVAVFVFVVPRACEEVQKRRSEKAQKKEDETPENEEVTPGKFKDPKLWTSEEIRGLAKRVESGDAEDHEVDFFLEHFVNAAGGKSY